MARRLIKKKISTRYCACPELECRFTPSDTICPNSKFPNGNTNPFGKFLWATAFVDEDTGEEVLPSEEDEIVEMMSPTPTNVVEERVETETEEEVE